MTRSGSRAHLGLPGKQQELLEAVVGTGKPVVLILFSGRPLTVPWAFEHVPAVLGGVVPGIPRWSGPGENAFRRCESERKARCELAAK